MKRTPLKRRGKKTAAWESTRAKLKIRFAAAFITRCELCGSTFALSFAHRYKRRNVTTQEELETVALVCQEHHSALELLKESEMCARITEIIATRDTPV